MSRERSEREVRLASHESTVRGRPSRGDWRDNQEYRDRPKQRPRYNPNYDNNKNNNYNSNHDYDRYNQVDRDGDSKREGKPPQMKEKPNFKPSGLLAKESNNVGGTQLKYTEPVDAAKPPTSPDYYLFIFKKASKIPIKYKLNNRSYHLIGRDEKIVDLETDDNTCSKQHAVIQFRSRPVTDDLGKVTYQIKPYIIDLESSNGTFVNSQELPTSRFIELQAEDTLRFGDSETDHVLVVG